MPGSGRGRDAAEAQAPRAGDRGDTGAGLAGGPFEPARWRSTTRSRLSVQSCQRSPFVGVTWNGRAPPSRGGREAGCSGPWSELRGHKGHTQGLKSEKGSVAERPVSETQTFLLAFSKLVSFWRKNEGAGVSKTAPNKEHRCERRAAGEEGRQVGGERQRLQRGETEAGPGPPWRRVPAHAGVWGSQKRGSAPPRSAPFSRHRRPSRWGAPWAPPSPGHTLLPAVPRLKSWGPGHHELPECKLGALSGGRVDPSCSSVVLGLRDRRPHPACRGGGSSWSLSHRDGSV